MAQETIRTEIKCMRNKSLQKLNFNALTTDRPQILIAEIVMFSIPFGKVIILYRL